MAAIWTPQGLLVSPRPRPGRQWRRMAAPAQAVPARDLHSQFLTGTDRAPQQQQMVLILLNWTLPEATLQYWQAGRAQAPGRLCLDCTQVRLLCRQTMTPLPAQPGCAYAPTGAPTGCTTLSCRGGAGLR